MSKSFKTIYNFLRLAILKTHQPFFIFIVNFEHISHLVLVFLLLTLSRYVPAGNVLYYTEIQICNANQLTGFYMMGNIGR